MSPIYALSKRKNVGLAASLAIAVVTALNGAAAKAAVVFSDNFTGGSTLDATSSLATVGTNATNYQLVSSKSRTSATLTPGSGGNPGDMKFGIAATTSGVMEAQALFPAVTLATASDYLEYTVVFTNTSGLLTQSSTLGFGLYNSNGSAPVLGGLNGNATANTTTGQFQNHTTDGTIGWQGYAIQLAYTGGTSRVMDRKIQNSGTIYDNDQDVIGSGSGSSTFNNPAGSTVGSSSATSALTLTQGGQYTEDMLITLNPSGDGSLIITSNLYSGNTTSGSLLATVGTTSNITSPLSLTFDALALGWRGTSNATAYTMDVNSISINSNVAPSTSVPEPATAAAVAIGALTLVSRRRKA